MNIHFLFPAWFLLLIPAAWACWHWRSPDWLHNFLRIIFILLLILGLSQPRLIFKNPGGVLTVVADRSLSMPPGARNRQLEIIQLLEKERGDRDRIAVIGFAEDIQVEQMPELARFPEFRGFYGGHGSRLATALATARAIIPKDRHGRILLLSDGRFTGSSPLDLSLKRKDDIPVDYRTLDRPPGLDLAIMKIELPERVERGAAFQFEAEILVPESTEVSYQLHRDKQLLSTGKIKLAEGRRHLLFQDRLVIAGNARYQLQISSPLPDPVKENNWADAVISVSGPRPSCISAAKTAVCWIWPQRVCCRSYTGIRDRWIGIWAVFRNSGPLSWKMSVLQNWVIPASRPWSILFRTWAAD